MSTWLPVVADLTGTQYCEVLRMDLAVVHTWTVAGVHYFQDNIAGLNLGQEIIKDLLPKYLAENFNANEDHINEKLCHLSFQWEDFNLRDCMIGGESMHRFLVHTIRPVCFWIDQCKGNCLVNLVMADCFVFFCAIKVL